MVRRDFSEIRHLKGNPWWGRNEWEQDLQRWDKFRASVPLCVMKWDVTGACYPAAWPQLTLTLADTFSLGTFI